MFDDREPATPLQAAEWPKALFFGEANLSRKWNIFSAPGNNRV